MVNDMLRRIFLFLLNVLYRKNPESFLDFSFSKDEMSLCQSNRLQPRYFRLIRTLESATGGFFAHGQEGEDIFLSRFFGGRQKGFFVDIGAHHPIRFSNTWRLYNDGWRGINIDATPGRIELFNLIRPDDINIEAFVSDSSNPVSFHLFSEPALNTSDTALAEFYCKIGYTEEKVISCTPTAMSQLLDEYLPEGQHIDLLSLDVEGAELGVLRSNNWSLYVPEVIVLELLDTPLEALGEAPVIKFLKERGYMVISKLYNSVILSRRTNSTATC